MYVLEEGCVKCDGDLALIEVGGTALFLDEHWTRKDSPGEIVMLVPNPKTYGAALRVLDCKDDDLPETIQHYQDVMMAYLTSEPKQRRKSKRRKRDKPEWTVPEGTKVRVWQDMDDPDQIGMYLYRCPDCKTEYEAYALPGGDWVLAGHPEYVQA